MPRFFPGETCIPSPDSLTDRMMRRISSGVYIIIPPSPIMTQTFAPCAVIPDCTGRFSFSSVVFQEFRGGNAKHIGHFEKRFQ